MTKITLLLAALVAGTAAMSTPTVADSTYPQAYGDESAAPRNPWIDPRTFDSRGFDRSERFAPPATPYFHGGPAPAQQR
jgi:hypothetical protein